jgi:hypothetical protein
VIGDIDCKTGTVKSSVEDVTISGFWIRDFPGSGIFAFGAQDATFESNWALDNEEYGIAAFSSGGTRVLSNVTAGSAEAGIYVGDSPEANALVADNLSYENQLGVLVRNALQGEIRDNTLTGNCVGLLFLADAPGPAGSFTVRRNLIGKNTKACPAADEAPPLSGVGVAILGANGVRLLRNSIVQNTPSGPSEFSGGVVVGRGLGGTAPKNNLVSRNVILQNLPDIFWDGSGSGNRFPRNTCATSKPAVLC